jgi:hypothetical protein
MANDIAGNPWVIDSTGTIWAGWIMPRSVRWDAGHTSSSGGTAVLTDTSGRVVWSSVATAADFTDAQSLPAKTGWNGLKCTALTTGKIYIEV